MDEIHSSPLARSAVQPCNACEVGREGWTAQHAVLEGSVQPSNLVQPLSSHTYARPRAYVFLHRYLCFKCSNALDEVGRLDNFNHIKGFLRPTSPSNLEVVKQVGRDNKRRQEALRTFQLWGMFTSEIPKRRLI